MTSLGTRVQGGPLGSVGRTKHEHQKAYAQASVQIWCLFRGHTSWDANFYFKSREQMKYFPIFHISLLEPNRTNSHAIHKEVRPIADNIKGKLEYEVDAIFRIERKLTSQGVQRSVQMFYLVKWQVYREDKCSWKPVENLQYALKLLNEFHQAFARMPNLLT